MARHLLTPAGQGDGGLADAALAEALAAGQEAGRIDPVALAQALAAARVFVGVEATLTSSDPVTGGDKTSEMALITLSAESGAGALPVFSSVAALAAWRPAARPVPVAARDAITEANRQGLDALVIDVAGPHPASLDLRTPTPAATRVPADGSGGVDPRGGAHREPAAEPDLTALRCPGRADGPLARSAVRAALRQIPSRVRAWPAELVDTRSGVSRPVLVVAVADQRGVGEEGTVDAESVARRLSQILATAATSTTTGGRVAVLVVDASETRAVRRQLGRGIT
jgi:hypothetical protein